MDFFASNIPILTEEQPASDTGTLYHTKLLRGPLVEGEGLGGEDSGLWNT